jgi:hypothetical protein
MRKILLGTLLASCLASQMAFAQTPPVAQPVTPALAPAAPPAPAPVRVIIPPQASAQVVDPAAAAQPATLVPVEGAPQAEAAPAVMAPAVASAGPGQVITAPTTLPPPPPGYVYAQVVGAPPAPAAAERREQIYGELQRVDGRLRELGAQRHKVGIGGPIALMASGYGVALVSGLVALVSLATAETIEHQDWWDEDHADFNNDGTVNHHDERAARNTARAFTGLAVVGLGMGIGGTVWFSKRMSERRAHGPEIHSLKERRRDLRRELRYGAMIAPDHAELTLRTRF